MGNFEPTAGSAGIATAIRIGLARKNEPQSALAELLDLSQPAIHRRMSGKVPWRIDELAQVAQFLGCSVTDLVGEAVA